MLDDDQGAENIDALPLPGTASGYGPAR